MRKQQEQQKTVFLIFDLLCVLLLHIIDRILVTIVEVVLVTSSKALKVYVSTLA